MLLSLFTDEEGETKGHDRWLCHAQQQGTGDEGIVASCPSAKGYCPFCKSQNKRAGVNMPICQSLQLISWHVYWKWWLHMCVSAGPTVANVCISGKKAAQMAPDGNLLNCSSVNCQRFSGDIQCKMLAYCHRYCAVLCNQLATSVLLNYTRLVSKFKQEQIIVQQQHQIDNRS